MHKSVVDVCVCVCVCVCLHLWLQSGLVCGCMSLASVCKESFNLASVCVCLPCFFFNCEWVCCGFGVLTVSWSVVCVIMWVQSGFGWCAFACMSARLGSAGCSSVEVCGCERCVDLEIQKEGKKSTPKGREAEVTSTVIVFKPTISQNAF